MVKDLYVIPVTGKYLIYSPLRQLAALVNKRAVLIIKGWAEKRIDEDKGSNIFKEFLRELDSTPPEEPLGPTGPINPAFLGIIPTRACNLSCLYCGFGSSSAAKKHMDLNLAVAAVDWMAEKIHRLGRKKLKIHFFGGEPFVAGEVVDATIHRAYSVANKTGLETFFELTSNGVFDKDRARFVGEYIDTVVLSFDGFQEIHDRHRPIKGGTGSFEAVLQTAHRLSRSPTELCLRMCVTKDSVAQLEETARWFCEAFRPSIIDFETLQPTPESQAAGLTPPDPHDFAINFIRASHIIESYGIQSIYAAASTKTPRLSFCPVGNDTLIVSPDGRVSNCYLPGREWKARGLDLYVGRLTDDGKMTIDMGAIQRLRRIVALKPRCQYCFCKWTCAGGCHVNNTYPGCSPDYSDFCIQTRIITACSILDRMGYRYIVDELFEDRSIMKSMALRPSDCLEDYQEPEK